MQSSGGRRREGGTPQVLQRQTTTPPPPREKRYVPKIMETGESIDKKTRSVLNLMIVTAEPLDDTCSLSGHVGIHGSRGPQNQKEDELLPREMSTAGAGSN